jgi:hypothetical protein
MKPQMPIIIHKVQIFQFVLRGQLLKGQLGRIPTVVFVDVKSKFMELPRQGCPLLLGEGSECVHDDDQPIHGSLAHGNESLVQPLAAHLI